MCLTRYTLGDDAVTPMLSQLHVVYLRDFLLGYLAAKGGLVSIEELREAISKAEEYGIVVAAGHWSLEDEIELLEHMGVVERIDGSLRLVWEKLPRLARKKIEKVSHVLTRLA